MSELLKNKNDIKIFVLYLLENIGFPMDYATINDIALQDGFVNYFEFADAFAELLETGNIEEIQGDHEPLYKITVQGIEVAETLQSKLHGSIREKSLKSAVRFISFREKGTRVRFEFDILPNDRFLSHCIISEKDDEIMRVSLKLESRAQLEKIRANFYDKPEIVYRGILSVLTGEINYLIDE